MKKCLASVVFCFVMSAAAFAQSPFPELEKVRLIKLLESTADDVVRIFAGYPFVQRRFIPGDKVFVSFDYSSGKCSEFEIWNVPADKVTEITVHFKFPVYPPNLGIDLSKLTREKTYVNRAREFVYHDKSKGVGYEVDNGDIRAVTFRPSKENFARLCDDEKARAGFSGKSWFSEKLSKRRYIKGDIRAFATIDELIISSGEVFESCADNSQPTESCSGKKLIEVESRASSSDPTDVLTYMYEVSGGKIVGYDKKVVWDLSGVKPGVYSISAGVDNGCGICGRVITKTVVVKECADCRKK